MKRRIFAAVLSAAMVLSLAACGGGNNGGGSSASNPGSSSSAGSGASSSQPDASTPDGSQPDASAPGEVTITLNQTSVKLTKAGATFQLKAQTSPEGGQVTFTSSDEKIITVDGEGVITAVAPGKAGVTVQCGGASQVIVSVECDWTVETKPEPKPDPKPETKPDPKPEDKPDASTPAPTQVDLQAFYDATTGKYQFASMMVADDTALTNFFAGLSDLNLSQRLVNLCAMMPAPNGDFVLIQVSDSKDVDTVKGILQARIDYMVGDGNGPGGAWYPMEQTTWEEYSRIVVNGSYLMLIAHENCDDIVKDFNALF